MSSRFDLRSTKVAVLFVLLATALVYVSCVRYEFTYDDFGQILKNPAITSFAHVPEYFTSHVWANLYPGTPGNYYRPMFLLWLLLNYKLFGLSPAGWHATNILVHLIATWLVFALTRRLTSDQLVATIAAFLFGVHPAHIESVAWVSGVTDPLMTVFFVAAFAFYLNSVSGSEPAQRAPRIFFQRSFLLSLLFYALALLTKETTIVFAPMIFCYEWLISGNRSSASLGKRFTSTCLAVLPYLVVTGVYFIVRTRALGSFSHQATSLAVTTVVLTIPSVLWFYIDHLIWPFPLSAFYETTYVSGGWLFWGPLAGLIVLAVLYIILARYSRLLLFLGCWVLLPILPLLKLSIFQRGEIVHDRYLYLPSVGFCIILSVAFVHVIRNYARYRVPAIALLGIIGFAWTLETVVELPQWKNDLALYSHGVAVAPHNNVAVNNLATYFKLHGDLERAIVLYKEVIERDPNYGLGFYNIGYSYYRLGMMDEAIFYLSQAIELNPRDPDQYIYYGLSAMSKGDLVLAERAFRSALSLRPTNAQYYFAFGVFLTQKGDLAEAREVFSKSVELDRTLEAKVQPLLAEIEATKKTAQEPPKK